MRNVFDQYTQNENKITHALLTALNEDRALLDRFLKELVRVTPPVHASALQILEQQLPGERAEANEVQAERLGIPDGWIYSEEHSWCIVLESKVQAHPTNAQIRSHIARADSKGFETIIPLVIAIVRPAKFDDAGLIVLEWRDVYVWLRTRIKESDWANRVVEFLEVMEERMIEDEKGLEGTLTTFTGFPFSKDNPLTYLEAKRCIRLAMDQLHQNRALQAQLGVISDSGRAALTRNEDGGVWDYLSVTRMGPEDQFNNFVHLNLSVAPTNVRAVAIIPNSVQTRVLKKLRALGEDGFRDLVAQIFANMNTSLSDPDTWVPRFGALQRRWPSIKAQPYTDAQLVIDLRTAFARDGSEKKWPKHQPVWLSAGYEALANKRGSNYEVHIGVMFPYRMCPAIGTPRATELIAASWLACKPLIDLARSAE